MLRKIRLTLAVIFLLAITGLFLDFTGTLHVWLGWMAKVQFLPAVMALNVGVILLLVALTLLLGRVYCSVICPLGVLQDVVSWISGRRSKKKRYRFRYSAAKKWLRYSILALFVVAAVLGVGSFVALLAPYSSFGRIVQSLLAPLYGIVNNLLATVAERHDSYAFYQRDVWLRSIPTMVVATVTLVAVVVLAWRNGRTYCNTICPVGTVLGFLARLSLLKPVIDKDKCIGCGLCARHCKASCIDARNHKIDYSRCVACMDCIDECKHGALKYTIRRNKGTEDKAAPARQKPDKGRRSFLAGAGLLIGGAALHAQEVQVDGGLAVLLDKQKPDRQTRIVPPGAVSLNHLASHCTACQLCVAACPNHVLRPSSGLMTLMQPESSYERGYCRPECTKCSEVCPTGAIIKIDRADKSSIQIGHAVWVSKNCVPLTDGVPCGNCARHCPVGAITMVASDANDPESPKVPVVNEERCIGCGACEFVCPARPFSAIYVEGHEVHRTV